MKTKLQSVKDKLAEYFSLDYRSLALMRFGAGLVIILDLIERARSLTAFYTDGGAFSRADLINLYGNQYYLSIHMMSGLAWVQAVLFIIAGIFAVMLMLGYRTTLSVIVSWFLLISLQGRNPMVLQGGDVVLRVFLFWMMFLPIGARWSLDRLFNRTAKKKNKTVLSPATLAYIVQIVLFYVMSGVLKTGIAWQDGTAVYYALSIDQLIRPLGGALRNWFAATKFLTYTTHYYEMYGSILYFSPWQTGLFRTVAICLYACMQIGFNLSMHLGYFGAISIVVSLGLLPPYFWDVWITRARAFFSKKGKTGLSIYYDTNCGFCFKMVHILNNFLLLAPTTIIAPADTDPAVQAVMDRENSWIVTDKDGITTLGFKGLTTVVSYSPLFFWLKYIFVLPGVRDIGEYCYRHVAASRLAVCLPELEEKKTKSAVTRIGKIIGGSIIIFLTLYVVVWNVDPNDKSGLLEHIGWIGWTTRLDQEFNMFAPTPLTEDGWYVMPATLQDGQLVDIFKDGPMLTGKTLYPVLYAKPDRVADGYPDQRWQKYLMNIAEADNSQYRLGYGRYLCRTWNATHTGGETLETFNINFMIETTTPPGVPQTPAVLTNLWSHHCF